MKFFAILSPLLLFITSVNSFAQTSQPTPSPAALTATLNYIEPRAHTWISDHGCVSCHTILPYMVGRVTPDALNSTVYQEIIRLVSNRTQNFDAMDPWYYGDRAPESKATESVINSFILTQSDRAHGLTTPSALTNLAIAKMKQLQAADGSWLWLNFQLEPWESQNATPYGASLAAVTLARSSARTNPANAQMIQKLKTYLVRANQNSSTSLWAKASILWAESEFGGIISADDVSGTLTTLLSKQLPSGGWSMNQLGTWKKQGHQPAAGANTADGYASAYVTYVLKKLKASGRVPTRLSANLDASYTKALDWLVRSQNRNGYWESASLEMDDSFNQSLVEDAAAGFALAVISE
jgi:hypothetical protein